MGPAYLLFYPIKAMIRNRNIWQMQYNHRRLRLFYYKIRKSSMEVRDE